MKKYNPRQIERKWQNIWKQRGLYKTNIKGAKRPYYNLMMFPYPSGEGLHTGHVFAFGGADTHGRFQRMRGNDVFEPMGYDAFGIHSENYAIKTGVHPKTLIARTTKRFRRQLESLGCMFDWDHEVNTTDPDYYKWTQWLFLQLYKAGLAYRAKAAVDWCPSCKTVLADEQVIGGKCERCDSDVLQKHLEQWFFKITAYAERLLKNLDRIDWSERTKTAQRNWIGRSEGAEIEFRITNSELRIKVFTTRPDTLFGATYIVLAPEHGLIEKLKPEIKNRSEVETYIKNAAKKSELERTGLAKEKTGVKLEGIQAVNPANGEKLPVFIADYVLAGYGTGAIMAVPAHDQRDFEFAKTFGLPIRQVIVPKKNNGTETEQQNNGRESSELLQRAYEGEGVLVNSGKFDGMESEKAKWGIVKFVKGKKTVTYHLRDWLISRQRYWGPPIPIVYCRTCWKRQQSKIKNPKEGIDYILREGIEHAIVPVPEKDLPVRLPFVKEFRPTGTGKSPLASVEKFVNTRCPLCKGPAKRETDVSDTFLDSSWYFLRYPSVGFQNSKFKIRNSKQTKNRKSESIQLPWNTEITRKWLPVDMYIGGQEHAVLHLLYARFITMVLKDLKYIEFEEPFEKFRAHGLITKDGAKMSKSRGNVVVPDEYIKKYGADSVRMYLLFLGPYDRGGDWSDQGIVGIERFLNRVWNFTQECARQKSQTARSKLQIKYKPHKTDKEIEIRRQKTIKKVTEDIESLRYNTAIAALMEFLNDLIHFKSKNPVCNFEFVLCDFLRMLAPFAPHMTEELWGVLGHKTSIHNEKWPVWDTSYLQEEKVRIVVQVNGRVRDHIEVGKGSEEEAVTHFALAREKVVKWIEGKEVKKVIFVPDRLINFVI